jgi:Domain of unknown function (DUF4214)
VPDALLGYLSMGDERQPVITPGGPRPRESTHFVPPGQAVRQNPDGTFSIVTPSSDEATESDLMDEELVLTPGGFRPKSKVHFIRPGHSLRLVQGRHKEVDAQGAEVMDLGALEARPEGLPIMPRHVMRAKGPVPAFGSGWIAYADWTNTTGKPVSSFTTKWMVPPVPHTSSGQTIFLFNGIQNSSMIYQPVLQWGPSAAGGGAYWAVASWYADGQGGGSHYSTLVRVNPGDVLTGVMTLTAQSAHGFSYNCDFTGIANTSLVIQNVQELTWCIETLEAYGITKATDYPATAVTAFTGIELKVGTAPATDAALAWTAVDSITDTGQHAIVVSNANPGGEVDIYYNEYREWLYALYADLLGRAPDPGGLAYWIGQLTSGASLQLVANGFLDSPEYCTRIITGLYQQLLSRAPDSGGLAGWVSTMEKGTALQQIISGFCGSVEYQKDNPVPAQFVESLYQRLLGRLSDPGGKQGWINALQAGRGTAYVINGFLTSQEYCTGRITNLYTTLLGRQPDAGGLAGWVTSMTGGTAFQQIQLGFLTSPEYQDRALKRFP